MRHPQTAAAHQAELSTTFTLCRAASHFGWHCPAKGGAVAYDNCAGRRSHGPASQDRATQVGFATLLGIHPHGGFSPIHPCYCAHFELAYPSLTHLGSKEFGRHARPAGESWPGDEPEAPRTSKERHEGQGRFAEP